MYNKGDIQVVTEDKIREEYVIECDEKPSDYVTDYRSDSEVVLPLALLPHSCDRWVIGGANEIRILIEDLESALKQIESK